MQLHKALREFRGTVLGWDTKRAGRVLSRNDVKARYNAMCSWAPEDLEVTA